MSASPDGRANPLPSPEYELRRSIQMRTGHLGLSKMSAPPLLESAWARIHSSSPLNTEPLARLRNCDVRVTRVT